MSDTADPAALRKLAEARTKVLSATADRLYRFDAGHAA